jgi:hypothetical protein
MDKDKNSVPAILVFTCKIFDEGKHYLPQKNVLPAIVQNLL